MSKSWLLLVALFVTGTLSAVDVPQGELIFVDSMETPVRLLNDTGQTHCDNGEVHLVECPIELGPVGQDAEYGWDVTEPDDLDGHAGFSFSKLDAAGSPLPGTAANWSCVLDQRTGLVWESKQPAGLHGFDDRYSWMLDDAGSNGGVAGLSDPGHTCEGYVAIDGASHCNTSAFVQRVNAARLCGIATWRLPSPAELLSLVDYSLHVGRGGLVDGDYFPLLAQYFEQSANYWTTMTYVLIPADAVKVNYWSGGVRFNDSKSTTERIRLVAR